MKILFTMLSLSMSVIFSVWAIQTPIAAEIMNVRQVSSNALSTIKRNTDVEGSAMQMKLLSDGNEIVFELNGSPAAKALYGQLPMTVTVENYGRNEKIFYPSKKLNVGDSPLVKSATPGTLAYYAPWGNVVMFYGQFGSAPGLYELGHATMGSEYIKTINGKIHISK